MARTQLQIRYDGEPDGILDIMVAYPRRFIRHVFRETGELLDISTLATADELNACPGWHAAEATGDFALVVTPGDDDVGDVSHSALAPLSAAGLGVPFMLRVPLTTGGAAGAPDDVTIFNANAPFAFRILDCFALLSDAEAASSMTLRDAAAGAGNALSNAIASAALGMNRSAGTAVTASGQVAAGGSLFLRRSDRNVAGELFILCVRS